MILVTGASGYLGGNLCRALISAGYAVRVFVRRSSDLSSLAGGEGDGRDSSPEIAYGDITDLSSLLKACDGCEVIFHTAAVVEPWLPDPSKFTSVNVGGLRNILEAYRQIKTIKKIIYTSSFFALGFTDGYVADEKQVHPGKIFCTEYEKSKAIADKIALEAATNGVPIVLLYPGVIYGPGKLTAGNIVAQITYDICDSHTPQVNQGLCVGLWVHTMFCDLTLQENSPITLYCDNKVAICIALNTVNMTGLNTLRWIDTLPKIILINGMW